MLYDNLVKMRSSKEILAHHQESSKGIISTIINFIVNAEKSNKHEILE